MKVEVKGTCCIVTRERGDKLFVPHEAMKDQDELERAEDWLLERIAAMLEKQGILKQCWTVQDCQGLTGCRSCLYPEDEDALAYMKVGDIAAIWHERYQIELSFEEFMKGSVTYMVMYATQEEIDEAKKAINDRENAMGWGA